MDPQAFIRLSIGSLGLRSPGSSLTAAKSGPRTFSTPCSCEIRLRGFPVQTIQVPFLSSPEATPDCHTTASSFYLKESDLRALLAPGCFHGPHTSLEIIVFTGRKGPHCGVGIKRQQIGTFKLEVGPEWGERKPVILFNGWIRIGKSKHERAELHLRVKLDPDPRYIFQFEGETKLSPQVVHLQGNIKQPIFSCKFIQDRVSMGDPSRIYRSVSVDSCASESDRRERKGWKVKIHDLSGSAVAAACITTPFVPSTGCDWVTRSNPGAWLILRPDSQRPQSWLPWGKLEAWRERGIRDSICYRFYILQECGEILMSEILFSAEKGGEFCMDTDRRVRAIGPSTTSIRQSSRHIGQDPTSSRQSSQHIGSSIKAVGGGFVMSCRVQGEGKSSKPFVQLAMRHVTCVKDAAIFMALAAAIDLSVDACRPFRRRIWRGNCSSW